MEKITLLKYILKLCLKFISNNKFNEAFLLTNKIFTNELDIRYIIDENYARKNDILDDVNFVKFIENLNSESFFKKYNFDYVLLSIYFTIILIKFVLNSYFGYLDLKKSAGIRLNQQIKNKQKVKFINKGNNYQF
jgi:hypothetical protein